MNTQEKTNTISELREIINFANENGEYPKDLFSFIQEKQISLKNIIYSIKNHDIYLDDILGDKNCFEHNGYFYNCELWIITREDEVVYVDDANFCEYSQEYTTEDITEVKISRRESQYWSESKAERYAYLYGGDYYENLENFDLVTCTDDDEIYHIDDLYYWESDQEYHLESEEESEIYVNDYHSGKHEKITFTENQKFFIGYEIEKEDKEIKESICISDFKSNCPKWRKERDGSLNSESGFELISPTMELNVQEIEKYIRKNKTLISHINAEKSNSCGGHINISQIDLTGEELFDKIKGYTPLFYALYHKRVDKDYCKGKKNTELKGQNEKYQAIKIHDNRVEYRIISAVPNFNTLIWRTKLFDFILNNQSSCPKDVFFKINTSPLKELLMEQYPNEKFEVLVNRIISFTLQFENIQLKK
jgi:hypothetical protein